MSANPPVDRPTSQGTNFTGFPYGAAGQASGEEALLPEGGWLAINGNMDLSGSVTGYRNSSVSKVYISKRPPIGPKKYCI